MWGFSEVLLNLKKINFNDLSLFNTLNSKAQKCEHMWGTCNENQIQFQITEVFVDTTKTKLPMLRTQLFFFFFHFIINLVLLPIKH